MKLLLHFVKLSAAFVLTLMGSMGSALILFWGNDSMWPMAYVLGLPLLVVSVMTYRGKREPN